MSVPVASQIEAVEAARSAATRSESAKVERPLFGSDDFARSMGITIHGEGIATPEEFNEGGRVTLSNQATRTGDGDSVSGTSEAVSRSNEDTGRTQRGHGSDAGAGESAKSDDGSDSGNAAKGKIRTTSFPACVGVGREDDPCGHEPADAVANRMVKGLQRSPDAAPPPEIRVREFGVSTPECMENSLEGLNC